MHRSRTSRCRRTISSCHGLPALTAVLKLLSKARTTVGTKASLTLLCRLGWYACHRPCRPSGGKPRALTHLVYLGQNSGELPLQRFLGLLVILVGQLAQPELKLQIAEVLINGLFPIFQ